MGSRIISKCLILSHYISQLDLRLKFIYLLKFIEIYFIKKVQKSKYTNSHLPLIACIPYFPSHIWFYLALHFIFSYIFLYFLLYCLIFFFLFQEVFAHSDSNANLKEQMWRHHSEYGAPKFYDKYIPQFIADRIW